jgi:Tfp pilus assembly protein FimT
MRQSHQKSRSRGRGRKPQNPLSRNYESNGPDVKIRGNAGHIAEKYTTIARDALSNGDTVMAENYFQHAEHYNRIVAAAQAARAEEQAQQQANGRGPQPDTEEGGNQPDGQQAQDGDARTSQNDNQQADSDDDAGEARPQKSSRNRRPRKQANADGDEAPAKKTNGADINNDGDASDGGVSESDVPVEAITEDASKLPESITGGFLGDE